jgi:hypothetical protein
LLKSSIALEVPEGLLRTLAHESVWRSELITLRSQLPLHRFEGSFLPGGMLPSSEEQSACEDQVYGIVPHACSPIVQRQLVDGMKGSTRVAMAEIS